MHLSSQLREFFLGFIRNEQGTDRQFNWFVLDKANRLTQAGLSHLNQLIKAFVYCILRAQDNVRSNILGDVGRAKEVQSEFIVLLEDAIRQPDFTKSVQHYWQAVDKAKVCLDLAAVPGALSNGD